MIPFDIDPSLHAAELPAQPPDDGAAVASSATDPFAGVTPEEGANARDVQHHLDANPLALLEPSLF